MGADRTCRGGKGAASVAPFPFLLPENHPSVPDKEGERTGIQLRRVQEQNSLCYGEIFTGKAFLERSCPK